MSMLIQLKSYILDKLHLHLDHALVCTSSSSLNSCSSNDKFIEDCLDVLYCVRNESMMHLLVFIPPNLFIHYIFFLQVHTLLKIKAGLVIIGAKYVTISFISIYYSKSETSDTQILNNQSLICHHLNCLRMFSVLSTCASPVIS